MALPLFNPETGEDIPIGDDNLGRARVSPDNMTIAAVRTIYHEPDLIRSLALVDIASGVVTDVQTDTPPDQLTWSPDGTLFYSTREVNGNLVADLTPDEQVALNTAIGYVPDELPSYTVKIFHYDPASGTDRLVYTGDGYAIGRLQSPLADLVVFSQVANQGDWLQGIVNGTIDPLYGNGETEQLAAVPVTLYLLPPQTSTPVEIGQNLAQFNLQPVSQ